MPAVQAGIALLATPLALALACSPGTPEVRSAGPLAPAVDGGSSPSVPDGGNAPRICVHDAKDIAPCAEDCDRGIASGCNVIASRSERGDGAPRDLTRAVRHYERACELRDPTSCVSAARMNASGAGVPPSRVRQVELLAAACVLGDALACSVPARAYASGNGVARDERHATELWGRACTSGVSSACDAIDAGD